MQLRSRYVNSNPPAPSKNRKKDLTCIPSVYQQSFFIKLKSKDYSGAQRDAELILKEFGQHNGTHRTVWKERLEAAKGMQKVADFKHGSIPQALTLFNLKTSAGSSELNSAYKALMLLHHPDKQHGKDQILVDYHTHLCKLYPTAKKFLEATFKENKKTKEKEYQKPKEQKKPSQTHPPARSSYSSKTSKTVHRKGLRSEAEKVPKWFPKYAERYPGITIKEASKLYNEANRRRYGF